MPKASSYADFVTEVDGLLLAVAEHIAELPSVAPHQAALAGFAEELKALKARQESARAFRQRSTQELKSFKTRGRNLIIRLRGAVKADLGPDNEALVQFGIAPMRKRVRRGLFAVKPKPAPQPAPTAATKLAAALADDEKPDTWP